MLSLAAGKSFFGIERWQAMTAQGSLFWVDVWFGLCCGGLGVCNMVSVGSGGMGDCRAY